MNSLQKEIEEVFKGKSSAQVVAIMKKFLCMVYKDNPEAMFISGKSTDNKARKVTVYNNREPVFKLHVLMNDMYWEEPEYLATLLPVFVYLKTGLACTSIAWDRRLGIKCHTLGVKNAEN